MRDDDPISLEQGPSPATQRAIKRILKRMEDAYRGDNHDALVDKRLEEEDVCR